MSLKIVPETLGLWRDENWVREMPGVYALVVGISQYPHLKGGEDPAIKSFDMGQLASSANTAAEIFEWLRDSFQCANLPVVWCQLLLSPTATETVELRKRGLIHYATPTHANMLKAIDMWTGNVPEEDATAGNSRTFFFYTGHGVQTNWYPVLLPSDYLSSALGRPKLENCIGVAELLTWMERNPVAEHFALIDACRNEFPPLAAIGSTANTSFPATMPGGRVPRTAASLSSASPNTVAYQSPNSTYTFFGQAVLEALRGGVVGGKNARLEFRELVDYVKPRINALLQLAKPGTTLDQTARQRIDGDDTLVVTEISTTPSVFLADAADEMRTISTTTGVVGGVLTSGVIGVIPGAGGAVRGMQGNEGAQSWVREVASPMRTPLTADVRKAVADRFNPALAVKDPTPLEVLRKDFGELHRRFGHEYISHLWQAGMALYALSGGQRIITEGDIVQAVKRSDTSNLIQVDLLLAPRAGGVLLVFEGRDFVQRERLAIALPTDTYTGVPIRLSLSFGQAQGSHHHPRLISIEARLGPSDINPHYQYLWELTREADLGSLTQAAKLANTDRLKKAAQDKRQFQTAAVAGKLLLARAGYIGIVEDWTRNLMNWFPDIPDGCVLWAESLRSAVDQGVTSPFGIETPIVEMASALQGIRQRGIPFFADAMDLAESQLRYVLRHLPEGAQRTELLGIQRRLEQVFQIAVPSGHFFCLPGLPRPAWMPANNEALSVKEMLGLLGRDGGLK